MRFQEIPQTPRWYLHSRPENPVTSYQVFQSLTATGKTLIASLDRCVVVLIHLPIIVRIPLIFIVLFPCVGMRNGTNIDTPSS